MGKGELKEMPPNTMLNGEEVNPAEEADMVSDLFRQTIPTYLSPRHPKY